MSLFTTYPTWHTTCHSSKHSKSIHQLGWRIDIGNISNRLIGPQTTTRYRVNASANEIFCQEKTATSQTTRRKLAVSYDHAYYILWSPISRFCLRRRSVRFDKLRLIYSPLPVSNSPLNQFQPQVWTMLAWGLCLIQEAYYRKGWLKRPHVTLKRLHVTLKRLHVALKRPLTVLTAFFLV